MTVVYTEDLATAQDLSIFWKILLLWRGSMYKIIWPNMLLYVASYALLSFTYRMMMTDEQRYLFERLTLYCRNNTEKFQVPFFLGFFVTQTYTRWWQQFFTLPWPDGTAIVLGGHMNGVTKNARDMRRQIIRYAVLGFTLLMRTICPPVKDRFKRRLKLVDHGLLSEDELLELRRLQLDEEYRPSFVVTLQWAAILAAKARNDDSMPSQEQLCGFLDQLSAYYDQLLIAFVYNWINLPICYTQLVTIIVYSYYGTQLIARQYLLPKSDCIHQDDDYYVPLYLFTQFFFFMGWLKTAEVLINPFGEDDDDLDINWLVDRNFEMTAVADDHVFSEQPKRMFDWYWSQKFADEMTEEENQKKEELDKQSEAAHKVRKIRKVLKKVPKVKPEKKKNSQKKKKHDKENTEDAASPENNEENDKLEKKEKRESTGKKDGEETSEKPPEEQESAKALQHVKKTKKHRRKQSQMNHQALMEPATSVAESSEDNLDSPLN